MIRFLDKLFELNKHPKQGDLWKVRMKSGVIDYDQGKYWAGKNWLKTTWKGRSKWLELMYSKFWLNPLNRDRKANK